jgi:hypothetical protein
MVISDDYMEMEMEVGVVTMVVNTVSKSPSLTWREINLIPLTKVMVIHSQVIFS